MANNRKINIALVCTSGGHFEQMTNLSDLYRRYDRFWITNRNKQTEGLQKTERMYFIEAAHYKEPWKYLCQVPPVLRIFQNEKPTHVLSTGSGRTAFIPFLVCRLLGKKFIYIDTYSRVHGHSKFGTFLVKTGNRIYKQWEDSESKNTTYIGPVFRSQESPVKSPDSKYIFVTVGTRREPFTRLLRGVEGLLDKGVIREKVIVQAGHTRYRSDHMELFDFRGPESIEELILNASCVVTQESAGIGTLCLKYGTRFIVMPREYRYGELPSRSDMREDLHYKLEEMGYTKVVRTMDEMEKAIRGIGDLKVGFHFDNTLAIQTLKKIIETGPRD